MHIYAIDMNNLLWGDLKLRIRNWNWNMPSDADKELE